MNIGKFPKKIYFGDILDFFEPNTIKLSPVSNWFLILAQDERATYVEDHLNEYMKGQFEQDLFNK